MEYHYQTQPLPHMLSTVLASTASSAHKASVLATHIVELVVPFFLFATRRLRHTAALIQKLLPALVNPQRQSVLA